MFIGKQEVREPAFYNAMITAIATGASRMAEIDIIGEQDRNTALFGECKWTNEKVDVGVLETLVKRSQMFHCGNVQFHVDAIACNC